MTGVERHRMEVEARTPQEVMLVCGEGCGRRIVLHATRRGYTVLDRGDVDATHSWSTGGGPVIATEVEQ